MSVRCQNPKCWQLVPYRDHIDVEFDTPDKRVMTFYICLACAKRLSTAGTMRNLLPYIYTKDELAQMQNKDASSGG